MTQSRIFGGALVACWLLLAPAAMAQVPAADAARVGVAAAVSGEVQLAAAAAPRAAAPGRIVETGEPIRLGDQITTGPTGRLQIMLLDETVFTIGPNAAIVIDQFVFDPASGRGKLLAGVFKGTFRFVTGRIAQTNPADMTVRMSVGTMGIRGTIGAGRVEADRALIVLLGPGTTNNAGERIGRLIVSGTDAGSGIVELRRPGYGTEIHGAGSSPSDPFRLDPVQMQQLFKELAAAPRELADDLAAIEPAAGGLAAAAGDATTLSGQGTANGLRGIGAIDRLLQVGPISDNLVTKVLTEGEGQGTAPPADNSPPPPPPVVVVVPPPPAPPPPAGGVPVGTSGLVLSAGRDLGRITTGTAVFPAQTFTMLNSADNAQTVGSYTVNMTVDFGKRETTGAVSVTVGAPFPRPGSSAFAFRTGYSGTSAAPAIQSISPGNAATTGKFNFGAAPLTVGGNPAEQMLSATVFTQTGATNATAVGGGISTKSGAGIPLTAAGVNDAIRRLRLQ